MTQPLSTSTKGRVTKASVITTVEYIFCVWPGEYSRVSCWTGFPYTSLITSYPRVNAASEHSAARSTWYSQLARYRRSAESKPYICTWWLRPAESFRHNQKRWFMADTTKYWLPWPVCRHHTVIPRRDGGPSTRSRTHGRAILGNKWYQARLYDGTTVIHISIISHAQWCVPWQRLRSTPSVPNWWKC